MNQIFQRFLPLRLRVQEFFFLLQENTVAALHPQQSVGIYAAEFRHLGGDILQKIAIMADDHTGKASLLQQLFQPLDSRQIQMVCRFIEQKNIGPLHQRLHNGETLLPASGQSGGFRFEIYKTRASQRLGKPRAALRLGHCRGFQCTHDHRPYRVSRTKF